jgi:lysophospholipase L1-like esterase
MRAFLAALLIAIAAAGPASAESPRYLALGDSVPVWNGKQSYPNLIQRHLRHKLPHLALRNLAVSGATTESMLRGTQYPQARRYLRAHRGHVALITIDIGGNDIVGCAGMGGPDDPCATKARATIKRNIRTMLRGLHRSAPRVPVVGMTYYDPYLGYWLAGGSYRDLALSTVPGLVELNKLLTKVYGGSAKTADVEGAFRSTDLDTMVASRWGTVPVAVARACSWLDIVCAPGQPEGFGDDPNEKGAKVIARAFERKIDAIIRR